MEVNKAIHQVSLISNKKELSAGDILFLVSCSDIVNYAERFAYDVTLVLHASDLPRGRGWSPHIWEIIRGSETIVVSLIEAEEKVDTGKIWHQVEVPIPKDFLWNEINEKLFDAEISLIDFAIREYQTVIPRKQDEAIEPTYYEKRGPSDSEIDPELSLASQFDQIRICDPNRFPAFFMLHGQKYKIILEKIHD
jgi:methionyl-tRNA formyltransferase